jgi:hypothetical protein
MEKLMDSIIAAAGSYDAPISPEESTHTARIGANSEGFGATCYELAKANPGLLPKHLKMAEFSVDYQDAHNLHGLMNKNLQIGVTLKNLYLRARAEWLQACLAYYEFIKLSAKNDVPGARAIYDELRPHFSSRSRRKNTTAESATPEDE